MRVLLINDTARPYTGGGNRVVVETCRWLERCGHQVALAYHDGIPAHLGCPIYHLPDEGHLPVPQMLARLDEILAEFRPDLIQFHTSQIMAAFRHVCDRFPTALFVHDQSWFCLDGDRMVRNFKPCHRAHGPECLLLNYALVCGGKSPLTNWTLWKRAQSRMILHDVPAVQLQVASNFMKAGLLENGFPEDRVDVVPLFSEPPPSHEMVEPGLVLCPSRLVRAKGVHVLLDALAGLPGLPWRLIIAGHGPVRAELAAQVAKLGIGSRVHFTGEVSPEEMSGLYGRAQIVAFPVLRPEPFGLVGVESLAYGKPIVAFAGGAVDEWLWPGETGIKVETRTAQAFGTALAELLTDRAICARIGEAARNRYARFEPRAYISRLEVSFERLVRKHAAGAHRA